MSIKEKLGLAIYIYFVMGAFTMLSIPNMKPLFFVFLAMGACGLVLFFTEHKEDK